MVILIYDWLLVIAVALVASCELGQMIYVAVSIGISLNNDFVGCRAFYHTGILCHYTDTGVNSCLCLNTCSYNRSLRCQKRNCLTLHVGTHQRTVCIVVLQEWDHCSCNREYHLRRYVHQVDRLLLELRSLCTETSGYIIMNKVSIRIQGLIRLCNDKVIFFICCKVYNLICNPWVLRICSLIYNTVRSLDKAVLVYSCVACQRVDQTDVRTLRRLDRAHTSIVGVVNISNLESGTVS